MSLLQQTLAVLRKDLLLDWRAQGRTTAVLLFGLTTLLLFSFAAGGRGSSGRDLAGGFLWLALLLASTLALAESFRVEVEDEALEGLVLLPVRPAALYFGKALGNTGFLLAMSAVLAPVTIGLFGATVRGSYLQLIAFLVLGIAGLAGPGTLHAAITARARGRDVLLPLLLFPLIVPVLVAAVSGTTLVLQGDPMGRATTWLAVLAIFDGLYWSACGLLFGKVVDA